MKPNTIRTGTAVFIAALALILSGIVRAAPATGAPAVHTATAVFAVHCYDEGHDALQGLPGVRKVERGTRFFQEINTVTYDPRVVSVKDLEESLKKSGTYVKTLQH